MYSFVIPTLLSVYLGIVISEPYGNDSKTEISAAPVIINSLTPTAVRPPTGIKNCSNGDVEKVMSDYLNCVTTKEWRMESLNPTSNGFTIFKEYCKKISFEECLYNASFNLNECIEDKNNQAILQYERYFSNSYTKWLSFWCYAEGSRMASFFAEKGPICMSRDKEEETKRCYRLYGPEHTNKTCKFLTDALDCNIGLFQDCHLSQTFITMFESSFNIFFEEASCPEYRSNYNNL